MFSLRFTLILLLVLLVPFLIRLLGEEAYPAVLLPSNAETINKNEPLIHIHTDLLGISNGKWQYLDQSLFFSPIPTEHLSSILVNDLGLSDERTPNISRKSKLYARLHIFQKKNLTVSARLELKKWIKQQLARQGNDTAVIRIVAYDELIFPQTGVIRKTNLRHDRVFSLD